MKKLQFYFLILIIIAILLTGCQSNLDNKNEVTSSLPSKLDSSSTSETISPSSSSQEKTNNLEELCMLAMNKWRLLGKSFKFKNTSEFDVRSMVEMYSFYVLFNTENRDEIEEWISKSDLGQFAQEYFDISVDELSNDLTAARYNEEKGYRFDGRGGCMPDNAEYHLLEYKQNLDNTYSFVADLHFEMPEGLVLKDEEKVHRTVHASFVYKDENIYFTQADYINN